MNQKLSAEDTGMIDDQYNETLHKYLWTMAHLRKLTIERGDITSLYLREVLQLNLATIAVEYWINMFTKDEK